MYLCVCVCIFLLLIFLAHLEHFSQSWSYYIHVINDHLPCWPDWSPTNIIPLSVCLRAFLEKSNWRGNTTLNIGGTTPWNRMKKRNLMSTALWFLSACRPRMIVLIPYLSVLMDCIPLKWSPYELILSWTAFARNCSQQWCK